MGLSESMGLLCLLIYVKELVGLVGEIVAMKDISMIA